MSVALMTKSKVQTAVPPCSNHWQRWIYTAEINCSGSLAAARLRDLISAAWRDVTQRLYRPVVFSLNANCRVVRKFRCFQLDSRSSEFHFLRPRETARSGATGFSKLVRYRIKYPISRHFACFSTLLRGFRRMLKSMGIKKNKQQIIINGLLINN